MYTIKHVPIEEIFFFVIQSIFTSQLYILVGMFETPSLHLAWQPNTIPRKLARYMPMALLSITCILGWRYGVPETSTFYLGCIAWWISPITLFLWTIAGDHFLSRLRTSLLAIIIPTLYLCTVDTIALRAGTWHINEQTSTGIFVWKDLPLEEAAFFTVTNALLVCGMSAFERSFAVIDVFGDLLSGKEGHSRPDSSEPREFATYLFKSLLLRIHRLPSSYKARIPSFSSTQKTLAVHSRSFHTASYIFPSAVRRDLVVLYAFCRVLDDFCDESGSEEEARSLISMSNEYLDLLYPSSSSSSSSYPEKDPLLPTAYTISAFLHKRVPADAQPAFFLLSTLAHRIPRYPFDDLIAGYLWDLSHRPINTSQDLVDYSKLVASSVAEMCVWAMWANEGSMPENEQERQKILERAASMGVALQITNIARDIREDAGKGRIYVPREWLEQPESSPSVTLALPGNESGKRQISEKEKKARTQDLGILTEAVKAKRPPAAGSFRYATYIRELLLLASDHTTGTSEAIRKLPRSCQAGIRAATGVYIGIGDEIRRRAFVNANLNEAPRTEFDGERVSMSGKQRIAVALREVYLKR